jgi:hypothetical protein
MAAILASMMHLEQIKLTLLMTTTVENERSDAMKLVPTVLNAPGAVGLVKATVLGIVRIRLPMKQHYLCP